MDKNTILGFICIALVIGGFSYFNQPSQEEITEQKKKDSIAFVESRKIENEKIQLKTKEEEEALMDALDSTTLFGACKIGDEKKIALQNNLVKVVVNSKGGQVEEVEIKNHKNQEGKNVQLFNKNNSKLNYTFVLKNENINTSIYYFIPSEITDSTLTLSIEGKFGTKLSIKYKLLANSYMLNQIVETENLENYIAPNQRNILISWKDSLQQQEKGFDFENRYSTITYKLLKESDSDNLSETNEDEEEVEGTVDWISFKNQFFSSVLIGYQGLEKVKLKSVPMEKGSGYLKYFEAEMQTPFDLSGTNPNVFQFYYGPNQYQLLQSTGELAFVKGKELNLENLIYLGWPVIRWINRFFTIYLFDWFNQLGCSMGITLLLLTLFLRILVYPTTRKSYVSSAKMRVLKPKIDEIQKKYPNKEDAMIMQQEIMATYSKYGASPMAGCLPMLIQMPIWIAMFNFVPNAIELRGEKFLWADDLSAYDAIITFDSNLPLIGDHISLFCILFCLTNLLYSWLNMKMQSANMTSPQAAQQMKMMQWMMMLMPIFFFFVFNNYSAGLNYYYWISLLVSALTIFYLRWRTDDAKLLAQLEKNYEKNANKPNAMRGFAARLQAMQEQQQAMRKQHEDLNKRKEMLENYKKK